VPLLSAFFIGLSVVLIISFLGLKETKEGIYKSEYVNISSYIDKLDMAKRDITLSSVMIMGKDKVFAEALYTENKKLAYDHGKEIIDNYEENSRFKNVKIHLHTKDVKSFLRVWKPQKNGDDLSTFRHTINEVKRTKKPLSDIEVGRAGLTYRGISPVFYKNQNYVGSIEVISGFNSLIKTVKKTLLSDVLILMNKSYLNIATKLKSNPKIGKFVVSQELNDINKELVNDIKNIDISSIKDYITTDKYLLTKLPLKDFNGQEIGAIIVGKDLKLVDSIIDEAESSTLLQLLAMILVDISVVMLLFFIVKKSIKEPLYELIKAIKDLSSKDADLTKRVPVNSEDELGTIARYFNKYLQSIEDTYKREEVFIKEAQKSINKAKYGSYDEIITAKIDNKSLEQFKDSVNEMLKATKSNFKYTNSILSQYKKHNYTKDLRVDSLDKNGDFSILVSHINDLKSVITKMLVENKKNGHILDENSNTLLKNVNLLNETTLKTEEFLTDANGALKDITDNISINSNNVIQMSNLANNVTSSAKVGEKLAKQTASAMEEINTQVTDISEAISIIDQISFQTNILSLNAAVEAATAGEAGKGFAVVASEVRNLASKSAEAAQSIKELVENALQNIQEGSEIAKQMIDGYHGLNGNISNTTKYISEIELSSKRQLNAIKKINSTIKKVTTQTNENASITKNTKDIAIQTDQMAKYAVKKVDEKEFIGKESV
jgi:methyl-accepting chemotaxis protein